MLDLVATTTKMTFRCIFEKAMKYTLIEVKLKEVDGFSFLNSKHKVFSLAIEVTCGQWCICNVKHCQTLYLTVPHFAYNLVTIFKKISPLQA